MAILRHDPPGLRGTPSHTPHQFLRQVWSWSSAVKALEVKIDAIEERDNKVWRAQLVRCSLGQQVAGSLIYDTSRWQVLLSMPLAAPSELVQRWGVCRRGPETVPSPHLNSGHLAHNSVCQIKAKAEAGCAKAERALTVGPALRSQPCPPL